MKFLAIAAVMLVASVVWAQGFTEDFEAGVPPAGWTMIDNVAGGGAYWSDNVMFSELNYTGASGNCAMCDSDWFGSGIYLDTELISPSFVVGAGAALDYDTAYSDLVTGNDYADVDINVGAGWVTLLSWDSDFLGPQHVTLDLSAYVGQVAQIRFHYYDVSSTGWDWYWQVDHVVISGTTPVESASWGSIKAMYR
jgi:hypothetical protein